MELWQKEEEDFLATTQEDCANYPWRLIKIFKGLIGGNYTIHGYCSHHYSSMILAINARRIHVELNYVY